MVGIGVEIKVLHFLLCYRMFLSINRPVRLSELELFFTDVYVQTVGSPKSKKNKKGRSPSPPTSKKGPKSRSPSPHSSKKGSRAGSKSPAASRKGSRSGSKDSRPGSKRVKSPSKFMVVFFLKVSRFTCAVLCLKSEGHIVPSSIFLVFLFPTLCPKGRSNCYQQYLCSMRFWLIVHVSVIERGEKVLFYCVLVVDLGDLITICFHSVSVSLLNRVVGFKRKICGRGRVRDCPRATRAARAGAWV